jgi:hypothetical protein
MILYIKKKWFYMLVYGQKKDEYREIKPYYTSRLTKFWCINYLQIKYTVDKQHDFIDWLRNKGTIDYGEVIFSNGYSAKSAKLICDCTLRIDKGRPEWGAEEGKEYYVFSKKIHNNN